MHAFRALVLFTSELLDRTEDAMRTQQIFEDTKGVVETLFDYHLTHDTNAYGDPVGVFEAIEVTMEDVRAFDVHEAVVIMHMRHLRTMMNV